MTPEEKTVIETAIKTHPIGQEPTTAQSTVLRRAVHALIFACPQCNQGGHVCPGDGNPIGHTQTNCGQHEEASPIEAEIMGTVEQIRTIPGSLMEAAQNLTSDMECSCSRTEKIYCAAADCHGGADVIEWIPTTLLYALAGDRIRIGQEGSYQESDVLRSSSGAWHANVVSSVLPSGKTWDKVTPWAHTELRLELSANPGFQPYPEDLPIEILMSREREAVHTLMTGFPGSTVVGIIDAPAD